MLGAAIAKALKFHGVFEAYLISTVLPLAIVMLHIIIYQTMEVSVVLLYFYVAKMTQLEIPLHGNL